MKRPPLRLYDFLRFGPEKKIWTETPVPFCLSENAVRAVVKTFHGVAVETFVDLLEPPFPHTWFEWTAGSGAHNAAYVHKEPGSQVIDIHGFFKDAGTTAFEWHRFHLAIELSEDTIAYGILDSKGRPQEMRGREEITEGPTLMLLAMIAFLNSPAMSKREHVDLSKLDKAQRRSGKPGSSSYTYVKLTDDAEEWIRTSGSKTYRDAAGRHWRRRHPHMYWTGKAGQERKTIIKFIGPMLVGGKEGDEVQPQRYRVT